jgi:hypothetical protein
VDGGRESRLRMATRVVVAGAGAAFSAAGFQVCSCPLLSPSLNLAHSSLPFTSPAHTTLPFPHVQLPPFPARAAPSFSPRTHITQLPLLRLFRLVASARRLRQVGCRDSKIAWTTRRLLGYALITLPILT